MNFLDKYIYLYSHLHDRRWVCSRFFTPFRFALRLFSDKLLLSYFRRKSIVVSPRKSDVIVSLTSFPARIGKVSVVIQCMLRQTISPAKIILWLSKDQFEGVQIPHDLLSLQGDIFEIRFVDGDIRSHKKYYYAFKEFPSRQILLVDDDIYYPTDMIEHLLEASKCHPGAVICRYGSIAHFDKGTILPYNDWWNEVVEECSDSNLFFGSGGGTLLKKDMLHKDVLNIDLALSLTPLADDIWLNAMVNMARTPKFKVKFGSFLPVANTQHIRLCDDNVYHDKNTAQLNRIIQYYQDNFQVNPFEEII